MKFKNLMLTVQGATLWLITPQLVPLGKMGIFAIFDIAIDRRERWMFRSSIVLYYLWDIVDGYAKYYAYTTRAIKQFLQNYIYNEALDMSKFTDREVIYIVSVIDPLLDKYIPYFCWGTYAIIVVGLFVLYVIIRFVFVRIGFKRRLDAFKY